jgi:hypothetical protein
MLSAAEWASLAISSSTSISAGYLTNTHSSDFVVPNSDRLLSSVDVGFNTLLWRRTMLSVITQFGITGHTPDFRVITAIPIRFEAPIPEFLALSPQRSSPLNLRYIFARSAGAAAKWK